MRYAGFVETGNPSSSQSVDESSMAKKTECYVDTSAFIAFLDKSDSFHALFRRLFSEPPSLITSSLVIAKAMVGSFAAMITGGLCNSSCGSCESAAAGRQTGILAWTASRWSSEVSEFDSS